MYKIFVLALSNCSQDLLYRFSGPPILKIHLELLSLRLFQYFGAALNQSLHSDNKTDDFIYKQSEPAPATPPRPAKVKTKPGQRNQAPQRIGGEKGARRRAERPLDE